MKIFGVELYELFKPAETVVGGRVVAGGRFELDEKDTDYSSARIPHLPPNPYKPMLQTRPYDIEPRRPIGS